MPDGSRTPDGFHPVSATETARELVLTESRFEGAPTRTHALKSQTRSLELDTNHVVIDTHGLSGVDRARQVLDASQNTFHAELGVQRLDSSNGFQTVVTSLENTAVPIRQATQSGHTMEGNPSTAYATMLRRAGGFGLAFRLRIHNTMGNVATFQVIEVTIPEEMQFVRLSGAPEHTITQTRSVAGTKTIDIHLPYFLVTGEMAEVTLQTRTKSIALDPSIQVRAYTLRIE